ncbi:ExsB family transcriptional regulator [Candidatus Woesearchaeota archaeon CG1_02_33_12]|nr:MAG: ExsB family transcriptional regulator [Candidatus Woesearchaeota archaeon CG1_02_33_12]PIU72124.1 MAG: ExsB family transcriptional regulator [Candidatus Woesearchaeota archaeon CG06_land_8_20_14_3_00_33_13]
MAEIEYKKFIEEKVNEIKELVGIEKVVSALSGGVDSAAATVLAHNAIGNNLSAFFIDTGFMRLNEYENISNSIKDYGIKVNLIDAKEEFFSALKGITDPEEKRKAFRNTFYSVFGNVLKQEKAKYLVQGTIKADVIETKTGIKTQHNVLEQIGINPRLYGLKIIEPLKELYKDDVRNVAKELGLPKTIYERMPFPGPGLSIRVIGEVTKERIDIVRKATYIVEQELKDLKPFQAFAVLMNDKATGIKNNERNYGNIIIIRSVESKNAITAEPTEISFNILQKLGKRIASEIPSIVRVAYETTAKPPATIEYE